MGEDKPNGEVRALVQGVPDQNKVVVALSRAQDPASFTSIALSADDSIRMAEQILAAALRLPSPPNPVTIRDALLKVQNVLQKRRLEKVDS